MANSKAFAFSAKNRLIYLKDFQAVFSSNNKIATSSFQARFCKNECHFARVGIIIRKHWVNLAVNRNYLKRLCREMFRQSEIKKIGIDIIILLKTKIAFHDKKLLRKEMNELWNRLATIANKF